MKNWVIKNLVDNQVGIAYRYHKMHDGSVGVKKLMSWLYLLWLNFAYHILHFKKIGKVLGSDYYESKRMLINSSESANSMSTNNLSVDTLVNAIKPYDVVSFDVFDTLIFRPLSSPEDAFYYVGERLEIPNFKSIRVLAERQERERCLKLNDHSEIKLYDIWSNISKLLGCDINYGIDTEIEVEKNLCYANPFMLEVWNKAIELGKEIVITSDMYLPKNVIENIVEQSGFNGATNYYISCDYGKNKATGSLYEVLKSYYIGKKIIHIGDNKNSDIRMAEKSGLATYYYPNVNSKSLQYRSYDMSYIVGSAYRGVINNRIYCGLNSYSMEYEYGYIYGGLFVLGYCHFIHEYCKQNSVNKVLFLSRDGDILSQVYGLMYPSDNYEYVYWSRKCATKLMASNNKQDYFRRFIYHKCNQGYRISEILDSMDLESLKSDLVTMKSDDVLTSGNSDELKRFIELKWDKVEKVYNQQKKAAKNYYEEIIGDNKKIVAIDIGWAGSGALSLSYLINNDWNINCELIGILAGTNTIYNDEPDSSESFLQSGKLVSYMYSSAFNRDLLKKHNPNMDYNVFWELLLSSPESAFNGFDLINNNVELIFGDCDANIEGIGEIQKGILDFASDYLKAFKSFPYMLDISGRDAYAPILLASSNNEKYLKQIAKKFRLEKNVV